MKRVDHLLFSTCYNQSLVLHNVGKCSENYFIGDVLICNQTIARNLKVNKFYIDLNADELDHSYFTLKQYKINVYILCITTDQVPRSL